MRIPRYRSHVDPELYPRLCLSSQTHSNQRCAICAMDSVQVYTIGWMCLNPGCRTFWIVDGKPCPLDGLSFDPSFTTVQVQPVDIIIDWEWLLPPPPPTGGRTAVITSNRYSRGMHCRDCGRLSCRFRWSLYECSNLTCNVCGASSLSALGAKYCHRKPSRSKRASGHSASSGPRPISWRTQTTYMTLVSIELRYASLVLTPSSTSQESLLSRKS